MSYTTNLLLSGYFMCQILCLDTLSVEALLLEIALKRTMPLKQEKYWTWNVAIAKEFLMPLIHSPFQAQVCFLIVHLWSTCFLHPLFYSISDNHMQPNIWSFACTCVAKGWFKASWNFMSASHRSLLYMYLCSSHALSSVLNI